VWAMIVHGAITPVDVRHAQRAATDGDRRYTANIEFLSIKYPMPLVRARGNINRGFRWFAAVGHRRTLQAVLSLKECEERALVERVQARDGEPRLTSCSAFAVPMCLRICWSGSMLSSAATTPGGCGPVSATMPLTAIGSSGDSRTCFHPSRWAHTSAHQRRTPPAEHTLGFRGTRVVCSARGWPSDADPEPRINDRVAHKRRRLAAPNAAFRVDGAN